MPHVNESLSNGYCHIRMWKCALRTFAQRSTTNLIGFKICLFLSRLDAVRSAELRTGSNVAIRLIASFLLLLSAISPDLISD